MHGDTVLAVCLCLLLAASLVSPYVHPSSALSLPLFLLSHLCWSIFIREATMRFRVENRRGNTDYSYTGVLDYTPISGRRNLSPRLSFLRLYGTDQTRTHFR